MAQIDVYRRRDAVASRTWQSSGIIPVMIVDDHPIIRRGLALALQMSPEFTLVGEAASGEEALALLEQAQAQAHLQPQVILMDLVMPGMDGVEAIRRIHDVVPEVKLMVFSGFVEDGEQVRAALQAGAMGYLVKDMEVEKLFAAIREAANGSASLSPAAVRVLVEKTQGAMTLGHDLTERERDVLALLVKGRSNHAIAQSLVITPATVKFHLRNIRSKLGTANRTETVVMVLQNGLSGASGKSLASLAERRCAAACFRVR